MGHAALRPSDPPMLALAGLKVRVVLWLPGIPMTSNENLEIFRRVIELGFNEGKVAELDRFVAANFVEHQFGAESRLPGFKMLVREMRAAFPDLKMTVEDCVATDDKVWARLRCRGTHNGPLMGIPPTGKSIDTTAVEICRVENGKLAEHWGVPDRFAAMSQLGLLPSSRGE